MAGSSLWVCCAPSQSEGLSALLSSPGVGAEWRSLRELSGQGLLLPLPENKPSLEVGTGGLSWSQGHFLLGTLRRVAQPSKPQWLSLEGEPVWLAPGW